MAVVVTREEVLDYGHHAPERVLLAEEEKSNGCQSVQSLTIPNTSIKPTEGNKHTTKLVNLKYEGVWLGVATPGGSARGL